MQINQNNSPSFGAIKMLKTGEEAKNVCRQIGLLFSPNGIESGEAATMFF